MEKKNQDQAIKVHPGLAWAALRVFLGKKAKKREREKESKNERRERKKESKIQIKKGKERKKEGVFLFCFVGGGGHFLSLQKTSTELSRASKRPLLRPH